MKEQWNLCFYKESSLSYTWRWEQQNSCPSKGIHFVQYMGRKTAEFMAFQKSPRSPICGWGNSGIHALEKESTLPIRGGGNYRIHALHREYTLYYTWEGEQRNSCPSKCIYSVLNVVEGTTEFTPFKKNPFCPNRGKENRGIHALQKESNLF